MQVQTVEVRASRRYTVQIGEGLLARTSELCADVLKGKNILLLTDETVAALYLGTVHASLTAAGFTVTSLAVPAGEESKSTATYLKVVSVLASRGFTRSDAVVALGGGVVGDLGGFCAASYLRGIGFVQIPTTLLACVDSSVGGKTAVNLPQGKNLLGAFYQPWLVVCDPLTLDTLTPETYADGMAEVIKYGMIRDAALFEALEKGTLSKTDMIRRCVEIKRELVEEDEHDRGSRQLLNFGHTVGHAVEKCSAFVTSHGSAVAVGMSIVARAAGDIAISKRLQALLKKTGLPTSCAFSAEDLFAVALADKKRENDTINLVTVPTIGRGELTPMPMTELKTWIEKGLAE